MEAKLITVLIISIIFTATSAQSHGNACGPSDHCSTGLICHEKKCACGNGSLTDSLRYTMTWDGSECVGVLDSACIGTGRFAPPQGSKPVRCVSPLTCVQVNTLGYGQGVCKNVPRTSGVGAECDQNKHCDSDVGLICGTGGVCECGNGGLTESYNFVLEWDDLRAGCYAGPGSACVVGGGKSKAVECWRGDCLQLGSMPPGVGVCQGDGDDSTTTTTTTTTTTEGTTSTTAGGSRLVVGWLVAGILGVLVIVGLY